MSRYRIRISLEFCDDLYDRQRDLTSEICLEILALQKLYFFENFYHDLVFQGHPLQV